MRTLKEQVADTGYSSQKKMGTYTVGSTYGLRIASERRMTTQIFAIS